MNEGCNGVQMFQGPLERVLPSYRNSTILSGTFEMLGKIIAHSVVQGGPGFPYLCPTLYWYIATGDLQQGVVRVSCIDILDSVLVDYVKKVSIRYTCYPYLNMLTFLCYFFNDATPSTLNGIMGADDFCA